MKVQCPYCNTQYQLDDKKIPNKKIKFKCRKCQKPVYVNKGRHAATKASPKREMVCPKCGQRQAVADECIQCGMTVDRNKSIIKPPENSPATPETKKQIQSHQKEAIKEEIVDCPKCSYTLQADELECPKCGIVIEKYEAHLAKKKQVESEASDEVGEDEASTPFTPETEKEEKD
jgi:predicted Zn finger-like uncharacterized protein